MSFGHRLKEARKRTGMTQKELGERLDVSASMIAQYETDNRTPLPKTLDKLAEALNVSYAYAKNGAPYFYTFVDPAEPSTSEGNVFNKNQYQDAKEETAASTKTVKTIKEVTESTDPDAGRTIKKTKIKRVDLPGLPTIKEYDNLNEAGRRKVAEYAADLAGNPDYRKDSDSTTPIAAHNDNTDDEEQQKLMKEDIDEL